MNEEPQPQQNILSEPEALYKKKHLRTFSSFEEANEADARDMAQLTPEQHLRNVTQLIKHTYEEELKTNG